MKLHVRLLLAVAAIAACHGVPLKLLLPAYLQAFLANLVSAAVRLVPLGQTDGQHATAALEPLVRVTGPAEEAFLAERIHDARKDRKDVDAKGHGGGERTDAAIAPPRRPRRGVSNGTLRASYLAMNLAWPSVNLTRQRPPQERP